MKAIVTVIGKDKVGIIAKVSGKLSELGVNVEDISQTIMQGYFAMMMMVEVKKESEMPAISAHLEELGNQVGVNIRIMHEDIFNAMHRI
ncbi:MAG: ACT domain-containing protein [Clostridia bacterium]|nr:ACT domain-containing protein [Clostridia bacterium]